MSRPITLVRKRRQVSKLRSLLRISVRHPARIHHRVRRRLRPVLRQLAVRRSPRQAHQEARCPVLPLAQHQPLPARTSCLPPLLRAISATHQITMKTTAIARSTYHSRCAFTAKATRIHTPARTATLALQQVSSQYEAQQFPAPNLPNNTVAPYFEDLFLYGGQSPKQGIFYQFNAGQTAIAYEYYVLRGGSSPPTTPYHFTVKYDSATPGIFVFTYYSVGGTDDQGLLGSIGMQGSMFFPFSSIESGSLLTESLQSTPPEAKPGQHIPFKHRVSGLGSR